MSDGTGQGELLARVAALEQAVEELRREVRKERAGAASRIERVIEALPVPPSPTPPLRARPEGPPPPRPAAKPAGLDLETLVGRYGMLALATLLALTAVGTFVMWAISHGLLGPAARVGLGLCAAVALAAWGARLRQRERSFGDSLMGLGLAIVHVCAWAAGPSLHLVPAFVALALSAAASVALSAFALLEDDEPLWCVGFGGAAIAPFVTSTGHGTAPMLAAYGAAVLVAGGAALGSRPWRMAARVFGGAATLFTFSLASLPLPQHSAELSMALPFTAGLFGVLPFANGEVLRPRLRTLGLLASAASVHLAMSHWLPKVQASLALGLAGLIWFALLEKVETEPAGTVLDGFGEAGREVPDWIDGALIPLGFALGVGSLLGTQSSAAFGLFATAAGVSTARRSEGALRDALAFACFVAAALGALAAAGASRLLEVAAIALVAALFALLESPVPNRTWRWAPMVALGGASGVALLELNLRIQYEYLPFLTPASAAALVVLFAWVACLRLPGSAARLGLGAFLLVWVHQELAWAVRPAVATLLLVSWYAVGSVAAVGAGRSLGIPRLRHVGLCLGVVAALLALKAAWALDNPAARIGAYLVVSVFLLGIAWWYRKPGAQPAPEAS